MCRDEPIDNRYSASIQMKRLCTYCFMMEKAYQCGKGELEALCRKLFSDPKLFCFLDITRGGVCNLEDGCDGGVGWEVKGGEGQ